MRAVIQPGQQAGSARCPSTQSGGWIPDNVTRFGTRFAESQGFSERLDAELEAAGVSLRSGEFVVGRRPPAASSFGVLGAALLHSRLLALVVAAYRAQRSRRSCCAARSRNAPRSCASSSPTS